MPASTVLGVAEGLAAGFRAPFEGMLLLWRERRLWRYAFIPIMINVVLFAALGTGLALLLPRLAARIVPQGEAWYWTALYVALCVIAAVALLPAFLVTFTAVGSVIGGPFYDVLSERVEAHVRGGTQISHEQPGLVRGALRCILEEVKKMAFYAAGLLVLLALNVVPVMGTVLAGVLGTVWTLLFLCLEFSDHYLGRHWPRFRDRWNRLWENRWASIGFGAAATLLLLIPVTNLALIPGAVVGATILGLRTAPPD